MQGAPASWVYSNSPQAIQRHLGRNLQKIYAALPTEPLPDALAALLRQLDDAEGRGGTAPDAPRP